jgi:hypothetical protein
VLAFGSFALDTCRLHQTPYLLSGQPLGGLPPDARIDVGLERHFVLGRPVKLAGIHVLRHKFLRQLLNGQAPGRGYGILPWMHAPLGLRERRHGLGPRLA